METADCKNFSDVIALQAEKKPEEIFLEDIRTERSYSFKRFDNLVEKTARYLIQNGIRQGDRITMVIENSPEFCLLYFGSIRIGAVMNPMPYGSHKNEILNNIQMVEPALIFLDQRKKNDFMPDDISSNMIFVDMQHDGFEKKIAGIETAKALPEAGDPDAPACLYYSSGTTSDPKGILFSHRNMMSNISSICRGFHFRGDGEVHLIVMPLGHTAAINYSLLPCAMMGGKVILAESFWKIRLVFWQLIEDFRVTYIEVVPTILYTMLNMFKSRSECDISSLPYIGCGSAPLQKGVQMEFYEKFGLKVANLYGLSETGPSHVDYPPDPSWCPGSIGVPLDVNEVKILQDNGQEAAPNDIGEIVIKGDNVFVGYYKNEGAYRQAVRGGFFYTGDLGYRDESGVFFYMDRKKDLIIKGGMNIVPAEIDEALMSHPAVMESVTVGVDDDMFGEEIKSFVTVRDGRQATETDLVDHCTGLLSAIKVPRWIEIVDHIPKTHSGKLLRRYFSKKPQYSNKSNPVNE